MLGQLSELSEAIYAQTRQKGLLETLAREGKKLLKAHRLQVR